VAVTMAVGGGEGGGWGRLEATSLGRWRGQGGRGMGGLSFAHFPELVGEVIFHRVVIPIVLPDSDRILLSFFLVPLLGRKFLELIVFLQEAQVNLVVLVVLGHVYFTFSLKV
jgi:hypothetical protein